jgi:hypothetical protein
MSKNFNKKLEIMVSAISELGKNSLRFKTENLILDNLDGEDILNNDFEDKFLKMTIGERYSDNLDSKTLFIMSLQKNEYETSSIPDAICKKLSEEQMKLVVNKYFDSVKENSTKFDFKNFVFIKEDSAVKNYILELIMKDSVIGKLVSDSLGVDNLEKLLNEIIVSSKIDIVNMTIKFIEENKIRYNNLPLIILNDNVSSKEKIEIIKATYKQKDMINYTNFIKNNMSDLNHIDSFIEATIIQNKRIKEKDNAIIEFVRRIFVGTRGNNDTINYKDLKNKKEFFEKYRKYFPIRKCTMLMEDKSWYARKSATLFVSNLYMDADVSTKLDLANAHRDISKYLFENINKMIENLDKEEDKTIKSKLFLFYLNENSSKDAFESVGPKKISTILSESIEIVAPAFNKMITLYDTESYWRELSISEKVALILATDKDVLLSDKISLISSASQRRDEEDIATMVKSFGFSNKESSASWRGKSHESKQYKKTISENVIRLLKEAEASGKSYIKEKVFGEFVKPMLDESYLNSDLLKTLSDSLTSQTITELTDDFKKKNPKAVDSEVIGGYVFSDFLEMVEKFFPEHFEELSSNLKRLENSLRIIINI